MLILYLIVYGEIDRKGMRNLAIYSLLVLFLYSCGIKKRIENAFEVGFSSTFMTQIAMTKILVESASAIYLLDSLEPGHPIYIHSLKANFVNKSDSFELLVDSVRAIWINDTTMIFNKAGVVGDSIVYDEVSIPYFKSRVEKDTLKLSVSCEYLPDMNLVDNILRFKCLTANYIIKEQSITIRDAFQKCKE